MFERSTAIVEPRTVSVFSVYRHPWQSFKLYWRVRRDLLGTLVDMVRSAENFLDLRIGSVRVLLLSRPEDVQEVLITQNRAFHKAKGPIFMAGIFGQGLLTTEGAPWRRARRLVQPVFHRQRVAAWGGTIVSLTHRQVTEWHDGQERDIAAEMTALAFTLVTETLFGFQGDSVSGQVRDATSKAMHFANSRQFSLVRLPAWIPTPSSRRFVRACQQLVDAVSGIIAATDEGDSEVPGLLTLLREAVDDNGNHMSPQELRDHCLTLLLAGHETTGNALAWLWYLLGQNQQVRVKLENELSALLGAESLNAESLGNLPYLNAVVRESLRLYPPAWAVVRQSIAPFRLRDVEYPANVHVVMLPWAVHRDPEWFDHPEEFRPERWLDGSTRNLPSFAYFPFGGGPRLCIGQPFALTEIALVVGTICQQFRLEPLSEVKIAPEPLVTLRPANGVPMRIYRRVSEESLEPRTRPADEGSVASIPLCPVSH